MNPDRFFKLKAIMDFLMDDSNGLEMPIVSLSDYDDKFEIELKWKGKA